MATWQTQSRFGTRARFGIHYEDYGYGRKRSEYANVNIHYWPNDDSRDLNKPSRIQQILSPPTYRYQPKTTSDHSSGISSQRSHSVPPPSPSPTSLLPQRTRRNKNGHTLIEQYTLARKIPESVSVIQSKELPEKSDYRTRFKPVVSGTRSKVISEHGHRYHHYDSNQNLIKYSLDGAFESPIRGVRFQTFEDKISRFIKRERDERKCEKIMSCVDRIRSRVNGNRQDELSEDLKRAIRGKSAGQITQALLADSDRKLREAKNWDNLETSVQTHEVHHRQRRGVSEARLVTRVTHLDMLDERAIDQLGCKVGSSLCDVKKQLQSFNQRTADIYHDSRCRKKCLH